MKKLMLACAIMATVILARAEVKPFAFENAVSVTAARTVYTNAVDLNSKEYKQVDKLTFKNDTTNACTFVTYMVDQGVATQISTSGSVAAGASSVMYPLRVYAAYDSTSNAVPYVAKYIRTIATLAAANGAIVADGLKFSVYAK